MRNFFSIAILGVCFASCGQNDVATTEQNNLFIGDSLAKNITVLASDEFQGRKPFTEGETKTINYLREQFSALGAEPGNGDSYFQEVPMVNIATQPDSLMQVQSPK